MLNYCTIEDVLGVATVFRRDVIPDSDSPDVAIYTPNTNTIARSEVEQIITEASELIRSFFSPRYKRVVIDSYDPDFPPVIVFATKTQAAILMYERYSSQSLTANTSMIASLQRSVDQYRQIIGNGDLFGADGTKVETAQQPQLLSGTENNNYTAYAALKDYTFSVGEFAR